MTLKSPARSSERGSRAATRMKYFEDIRIGDRSELGTHHFSADEIKIFARRFDPQRFHVDEAEAERTHFGKLCASGWHTAFLWMRALVEYRRREADAPARARRAGRRRPVPRPASAT